MPLHPSWSTVHLSIETIFRPRSQKRPQLRPFIVSFLDLRSNGFRVTESREQLRPSRFKYSRLGKPLLQIPAAVFAGLVQTVFQHAG